MYAIEGNFPTLTSSDKNSLNTNLWTVKHCSFSHLLNAFLFVFINSNAIDNIGYFNYLKSMFKYF